MSPSRFSTASRAPVEAPEGTAARPKLPSSSVTSTSTVGLPRLSMTVRAWTSRMAVMWFPIAMRDRCGVRGLYRRRGRGAIIPHPIWNSSRIRYVDWHEPIPETIMTDQRLPEGTDSILDEDGVEAALDQGDG